MLTIQKKFDQIEENLTTGALALFVGDRAAIKGSSLIELNTITGTGAIVDIYVTNDVDAVKGWIKYYTVTTTDTTELILTEIDMPFKYLRYDITIEGTLCTAIDNIEIWGHFIIEGKD